MYVYVCIYVCIYVCMYVWTDISRNKVDSKAAVALREFLSSKQCNLTYLSMANANIDDYEVRYAYLFMCKMDVSRTFIYICMYVCMYVYCSIYVCMYDNFVPKTYVYIYVCMYVCMYAGI